MAEQHACPDEHLRGRRLGRCWGIDNNWGPVCKVWIRCSLGTGHFRPLPPSQHVGSLARRTSFALILVVCLPPIDLIDLPSHPAQVSLALPPSSVPKTLGSLIPFTSNCQNNAAHNALTVEPAKHHFAEHAAFPSLHVSASLLYLRIPLSFLSPFLHSHWTKHDATHASASRPQLRLGYNPLVSPFNMNTERFLRRRAGIFHSFSSLFYSQSLVDW